MTRTERWTLAHERSLPAGARPRDRAVPLLLSRRDCRRRGFAAASAASAAFRITARWIGYMSAIVITIAPTTT